MHIMARRKQTMRTTNAAYWMRLAILANAKNKLSTTPRSDTWGHNSTQESPVDMDVDSHMYHILFANRTAPVKKKGGPKSRQGAKMVKKLEQLTSVGHELCPEEATMFRALSARANFLAQDRPDIAFSTKELCREFAIPNRNSHS